MSTRRRGSGRGPRGRGPTPPRPERDQGIAGRHPWIIPVIAVVAAVIVIGGIVATFTVGGGRFF